MLKLTSKLTLFMAKHAFNGGSRMKSLYLIAILSVFIIFFFGCKPVTEDQHAKYNIGDVGPGGGLVFYDKGSYAKGWRYLEVSPSDLENVSWGCVGKSISKAKSIEVGLGKRNTDAILRACEEERTAARFCSDYRGGGKDDWFLPSKEELDMIYKNLHLKGIGEFGRLYWSSSEKDIEKAWILFFISGNWSGQLKFSSENVRAVRAF